MQKNTAVTVLAGVAVVLIAGLVWWHGTRTPEIATAPEAPVVASDPYWDQLETRSSWVVLVTSDYVFPQETSDGVAYTLSEHNVTKLSLTPELEVNTILESSVSASLSDPDIDALIADALTEPALQQSRYTVFDAASATWRTYTHNGSGWVYVEGDYHPETAVTGYRQLWGTGTTPQAVAPGEYTARDSADYGTYTFYFDPATYQLQTVDYVDDEGVMSSHYQLLDEPAVTTLPADVQAASELLPSYGEETTFAYPTVSDEVYAPEDIDAPAL